MFKSTEWLIVKTYNALVGFVKLCVNRAIEYENLMESIREEYIENLKKDK